MYQGWQQWTSNSHTGMQTGQMQPYNMMGWGQTQTPYAVPSAQTMGSWPATNMVGTNMATAATTTTTTSTNQTPAYSTSSYMSTTTPAETKTVSAEDSSTTTTTTTTEVKSTLEDTSNQTQTEKNGTETATAAQPEQQLQPTNSEEEERLNYLRQQAAQWQAHQAQWQQYQYQYQYQYPYTYPQYYPPASDIHQNPLSAISTQPPPPPPASQPPPTTQSQLTSQLGSTFQPPPPPAHPPPPPQLASNQTAKTTQLPSMSQPPPNLSQPPPSLSQTPLSLTQPPPSLSQPPPSLTQTPASNQLLSSNKPQLINHLLLSGQPPGPPPPPNTVTSNQTASGGPLSQSQSFTSQNSLPNQVSGLPPTTNQSLSSSQDPLQMPSSQYQQSAKSQHYSSQQSGYSSTSQNYQQHSGQPSAKPFHQMQFSQPPPMKHGDQSQSDSHQSYSDSQHHYNEPPPVQFSQQSFNEPPPMQHPRQQFMPHSQSNQMQQSQYMQHSQPPPQSQQHQSSFSDDSSYNQQYQPPFSKPHQKGSYSQQPNAQSHDNIQFQQQPPPIKPFQRLTPQAQQRLTPQAQQRLLQQAQQQRMAPQSQQQRLTPQAQQRLTPQAQQRLAQNQQRPFPNQKMMLSKQPQEMFKDIGDPNSDFERQFQDWVQNFEMWRDENKNHPDQDAFTTYEQQHLQTRNLLLQKKEQMIRTNDQSQRMEPEKYENQRFPSQDKKDFGRPPFGQGNFRSQQFRTDWDDSGYGQNRRDGPGFGPNRREGPGFGQNRREGPGFGQRQDNSNFGQNRRGGYDQNRRDEEFYDRSEMGYQRPGQNRQRFSDAEPHEYTQRDEPFDDFDKENMYGNDSQSRSSFPDSMNKNNQEMNVRNDFENSARNENAANEKLGQMERESDLSLKRDTGEQGTEKDKDSAQKENAENNKNLENTSAKNDGKNESDKDGESQTSGKDKVRDKFDEDDTEIDGPGNFEPGDEDEQNEGSKPKLKPNETSDKTSRMGDNGPRESLLGNHPSQRPSFDFEDSQNSFKSRDSRGRDGSGQMYGGPGQMGRKRYPSDNGDDISSGDNRYGKQMRGDDDWKGDNQKQGDRQFGSRRSFSPGNQRKSGRRDSWDSSDQHSNDRFDSNRQEENFRGRGQFNDRFGGRGGQERMISPWINNQPPNTLGVFQRGVGNIGIRFQGPLMDQKFNQEPMAIHLQEQRNDGPFGGNKVEFRFQLPGGECDNKRLPLFPHEIVTNENRDPLRRNQDMIGDKDKGTKQSLLGDGPGPRLSGNRDIDNRGESRFEVSFGSGRFDGPNNNRNSGFDRKDRWGRRNMNERSMMDDRMNPMRQKSDMDCGDSGINKSTVEFHFNRGQMIGASDQRPLIDNQDLFGKIMHLVNRYSEHGDLDKGPMQNDRFMDDDDDDEPGFRGRNRGRGRDRQFSRGDRGDRGRGGDRDDDRGGRGRRGGDRGRGGRGGGGGGRNDDHDRDGDRGRNRERGRGRGDRGRGRGRGRGFDRDDWDRNSAESHGTDDLSEEHGRDDEPFFGRRDDDNQGGKNKQDRRRNWNENRFSNRFSQRGGKSFRRDKNFKENWDDDDDEEEPNPNMQFSEPFVEPTVTIDYGHKPAAEPNLPNIPVVKDYGHGHGFEPEEFNKNYQEFNFAVPQPPVQVAFGRVQMETIDYGHGQGGSRDYPSPERVIDYGHGQSDRSGVKDEFPKMLEDRDDRTELDREKSRERMERVGRERERDHSRGRDRERDRERDRDKDHDRSRIREDRDRERNIRDRDKDRDMRDRDRDKDKGRDGDQRSRDFRTFPIDPKYQEMFRKSEPKSETVLIEDLLSMPGRQNRPSHIVIILRGPPGSGKSFVAKLIKDKEVENGGSAPRMLCLDDYFMVETEKTEVDPETGKQIKSKVMEYEYDSEMESSYQTSLLKSFKKTIENGFFPFIIVDAINEKCRHFEEMWSFAKQRGFQVYIAEMDMDSALCHKRNIHGRNLNDITRIIKRWDLTPRHYLRVDIRSLLQDAAIPEVEMEDSVADEKPSTETCKEVELKTEEETPVESADGLVTSRWEQLEATEEKLDRLDGIQTAKRRKLEHQSLEEYLQLPDDYELRHSEPGKKRVRWADIEERKESDRKRALGFVIGQTDWEKITDPTAAERALAKTKYF